MTDETQANNKDQKETGAEVLAFPLHYDLKVIFHDQNAAEGHWEGLKTLLDTLEIPHEGHRLRPSAGGKYISITVPVDIKDRLLFDALYENLKALPEVKCAI